MDCDESIVETLHNTPDLKVAQRILGSYANNLEGWLKGKIDRQGLSPQMAKRVELELELHLARVKMQDPRFYVQANLTLIHIQLVANGEEDLEDLFEQAVELSDELHTLAPKPL